jgi:hypothetical protein
VPSGAEVISSSAKPWISCTYLAAWQPLTSNSAIGYRS